MGHAERFECRWATVEIHDGPAIMLQGMSGSIVGIWVAHGEGRCLFPDPDVMERVLEHNLAPIRYSLNGRPTTAYPHNPNDSPHGIAALCSSDGRHLAMMPHPERCAHTLWHLHMHRDHPGTSGHYQPLRVLSPFARFAVE
jgi:phosphoribosylformylglycinamidine synthase